MSLETLNMPCQLVEAVIAIPDHQFHNGEHLQAAKYLSSLGLTNLGIQYDEPAVLKLDGDSIGLFAESFSRPTPTQVLKPALQPVDTFDLLQLAVATTIGQPLSMPHIRMGAIVQDIFPTEDNRYVTSSSYGSEAEFAFHNDLSFLDDPGIPDYFTLGCVRNIEGAETSVADIHQILDGLSDDIIAELRKPNYGIRHTYNRGLPSEYEGNRNTSIILANNELRLGVDMIPQTDDAHIALMSLRGLLSEVSTPHQLRPGEILVVPNRFAVHGRGSFVPSQSIAQRRWLQRVNIKEGKHMKSKQIETEIS